MSYTYRRPSFRRPRRVWIGTSAAFIGLSGTIAATSSLTANLHLTWALSGQVDAVAALSGSLYRTRPLSGTVAAASTLTANLHPFRGLSGTVAAQAALSALLYRTRSLSGDVEAVSALAANLYVIWYLQGAVAAASYLVANLEIVFQPFRPQAGQAVGDEALTAISRLGEGLAAQALVATPILPGRGGIMSRIPLGSGRPSTTARNRDENPSFETNLDGLLDLLGTFVRSSSKAKYGTYSCRGQALINSIFISANKVRVDGSGFPVVIGDTYIHSLYGQAETGVSDRLLVAIQWLDAGGGILSTSGSDLVYLSDSAWTRVQVVAAAPADAVTAQLLTYIRCADYGGVVYTDGQEFRREASYTEPYLDGDQGGCEWLGTDHASISQRLPVARLQGAARTDRTMEGEAETDRPPVSGKAR